MRRKENYRMWNTTVAAGLSVSMLLAGCGAAPDTGGVSGEDVSEEKKVSADASSEKSDGAGSGDTEKELVTFRVAVSKHTHCMIEDFNEMAGFKMAEEATGVHIEWITVQDGATEKVNAMLTADLPDAFLGLLGQSQIAASMDSFLDIRDLLETYAPHVVADYSTIEGGMDLVTWPDGSIRSLATGDETNYANDPAGIMIINKKWMDDLNLEMPTTTEEFYEVLCAFRDNDANGNGDPSDEIPFKPSDANWCAHVINMANAWGIAGYSSSDVSHYFMVKDGKAVPTMDTEEYRAFLEYMHRLVEEGLFDKESFTETNDQYFATLKSGVVGATICWSPYAMMSDELAEQYVVVPYLNAPEGGGFVKSGRRNDFLGNIAGFAITSNCKQPERLLEWWDYLSSSLEMKYTTKFGPRGGYWDIDENGEVFQKTPENLTDDFTVENYKYTNGMVGMSPLVLKNERISVSREQAFSTWYRINETDQVWEYLQTEYPPQSIVAKESLEKKDFIETDLMAYLENFNSESILKGLDDKKWQDHLEALQSWQYYEWIQWYQDYIDGKY